MPTTAAKGGSANAGKLLRFIERRRETLTPLLILTHDFPDPDALAAAFALQLLVGKGYGIRSKIVYGGVIGRTENRAMVKTLGIPARRLTAEDLTRYRHVALVDTQPGFENNPFPPRRRATIVIDQHASVAPPAADLSIVDVTCGATCVIVAQALLLQKWQIPVKVATALAYGILTDTLDLYRARGSDAAETYLRLLSRCDVRALAKIRNPERSRSFFVALGRGIREATKHRRLIVSHLKVVANPDLVSHTAEFLLTYEAASWVLCTGRYNGRLHVSLRTSQRRARAAEILRSVAVDPRDAGGHGQIAGGSFLVGEKAGESKWQTLERELQLRLARRLQLAPNARFRRPFFGD